MIAFPLVALSFFILANCFTKEFRSFQVTFLTDDEKSVTINFDPFVRSFKRSSELACKHFRCDQPESMESYVRKLYEIQIEEYKNHFISLFNNEKLEFSWDTNSDDMSRLDLNGIALEIKHLKSGIIRVRQYCNITEKHAMYRYNVKKCIFADLMEHHSYLTMDHFHSKAFWVDIAEQLFNNGEYHHAEAISIYILSNFSNSSTVSLDENGKAWIMVSEIAKMRGNFNESSIFEAKVWFRHRY